MKFIYLIFLFIIATGYKISQQTLQQVKQTGRLRVKGYSNSEEEENKQRCCFSIIMENKNKRKGYDKMKKKYNTIRNILLKRDVIQDGSAYQLVKQQTRMNHKKKIWYFKRIVCVLTEYDQQANIKRILKKQNVNKMNFGFQHNNQQDRIMKALNDANRKAKIILNQIDYRIIKIQSISVLNKDIQTWIIDIDISSAYQELEESSLSAQIKKSTSTQQLKKFRQQEQNDDVEIQMVFSVVEIEDQDENQSSSDEQAQSQKHVRESSEAKDDDSSQDQL